MKTLFKCMVDTLDYFKLRLPQINYYIEKNNLCFTLPDGTKGLIEVDFVSTIQVTPDGNIQDKKTGFVIGYKYNGQQFLTKADAVLSIANKHQLNIFFGATACDDIASITPPFSSNPFRFYTEFPKLSSAILFFNPEDQLKSIKTFNRTQCKQGFKFNEKYPLTSPVITKLEQRLSSYNTAHAEQLEFLK